MSRDVAKILADLTPAQRDLFLARLKAKSRAKGEEAAADAIPRRPRELAAAPLSFGQERLWFLEQLNPEDVGLKIPQVIEFRGPLDPAAFAAAFAGVVARHESLRTTFGIAGGRPVQVVAPALETAVPVVDLSTLSAAGAEEEACRLAILDRERPFELGRGPLVRLLLSRLAAESAERPERWWAMISLHHIISDGWSLGVLLREMGELYAAAQAGAPSPLPALPIQYPDYAAWQREWLTGPVLERQLGYWRRQLAGAELLDLPADGRRGRIHRRGARFPRPLAPAVARPLFERARRTGATPFISLYAAFAALLGRHAGQADVALGSVVASRNRREVEGLIGFFVNTQVMRVDIGGDPPYRELVDRVRQVAREAFAHQDLPFERLVEALKPERAQGDTPYFRIMMLWNEAFVARGFPGLDLEILAIEGRPAQFDLTLVWNDTAAGPVAMWDYDPDVYDKTTVLRLAGHMESLLAEVAADPERRVSELALLSAAERQQAAVEWNDPSPDYPAGGLVHGLFWAQAARRPHAAALVWDGGVLSYGGLAARVGGMARRLRALGVGPEARVGISAERSPALVAGLLAILEAGGAYVPLDPAYPAERLAAMAADAGLSLVLGDAASHARLPARGMRFVDLAALAQGEGGGGPRPSGLTPDNAVYVIYTSGSTGRPKGVVLSHRAVENRLAWSVAADLDPGARMLQKTTASFDVSVAEIFGPLAAGAAAVLARPGRQQDVEYLAELMVREQVTHANLPPSLLSALLDQEALGGCRSLRRVVTGSEAVPPELAARFHRRLRAELFNRYGPTEAAVATTSWRSLPGDAGPVPIGRPIARAEILVLDRWGCPAPIGIAGEVHIGGACLARGYLGDPAATARRFVPCGSDGKSGGKRGERLYRTGDLARLRRDGALEFLGRADGQVKVRGARVEVGEIEAALCDHPAVAAAAVVVREEGVSRKLVGYWAAAEGVRAPAEGELKEHLAARLPDFMVPAALVRLDALPLMPNGKVDRRALAARPLVQEEAPRSVAPRTPMEELVAAVWADVLGRERVGVLESFFDLGGHSLLATQVVSRLRTALGVELPLRRLFEAPTVEGLAAVVLRERAGGEPAPPIRRVPRDGPLPASFAQERLWFLDQLEPGGTAYSLPMALRLSGDLSVTRLAACLAEIVRRHEALRTTFAAPAGRPLQVIAEPRPVELPVADLSGLGTERADAEASRLVHEEARHPFDLARGPLLRARLARLAAGEHLALLTLHHIVTDGWSMGVLVGEIAALYGAAAQGAPSPLPEPPVQYADFAVWQRGWLAGDELQRQLAYWRERLAGAPAALDLPADRPRPPVARTRGADLPFALPPALAAGLARMARRDGATLFMVLLAGFEALLARLSGQDDLVVGTTIANRTRRELEGLVGFFVNTLALRADVSDDPGFRALAARAREAALGAYAHQDLPFEKLVDELRLPRDPSRSPIFQVVLQMQNAPAAALRLPGLELSPVEAVGQTAKFDLVLNLVERGGEIAGLLRYNTDLFDGPTMARWSGAYERLLASAVEAPEWPVSELALLSPAERQQLLEEWSSGVAFPPSEVSSLAGLVARQAGMRPEAVAISLGEERLSYGELASRAQRLAGHLAALGVGRGSRVGLLFERSAEMVVAVVGTLWAGAAYVPLDPDYPEERLRFALEDSGVPVVLTAGDVADRLALPAGVRRLRLEEIGEDEAPAEIAAGPDEVAYVIYTSGSTGRPKGVLVTHGNVLRLLAATDAWFSFGPSDVWTLFHSYAFDFSVWELWGALGYGGRLAVVPYWVSRSPSDFLELLAREGATVLNQTPSAFQQLARAEEAARQDLSALRVVVFGGERLETSALAPWWKRQGDERPCLVNMYGITETTVHVTYRVLNVADAALGSRIGRPIPDLSVYLLDPHLEPVLPGSPGEIVVGGAGVAVGYLGRPELTAQRFVPDPFGCAPGARLYRSGDLARYHADGDLEVLGRIDRQVKVRGFRIELGEIEAALRASAEVAEAAVLVVGETAEERRLVACVMPVAGMSPSAAALRDLVAASLPDYMVPSRIVTLPSLPLTANGKLDRTALAREIERTEAGGETETWEPPRTDLEVYLAGLFGRTVRAERVGLDDDFFALGGNSMSGAVLVNELQQELGEIVHVVTIFDAPTVRRLAAYLAAEHPAAVARRWPEAGVDGAGAGQAGRVDEARVAVFKGLIRPLAPLRSPVAKNPPALFVLAPPRSGTTLLRVMLGGHPRLFAPPELELLSFDTLAERSAAFSGRDRFWLEGAVRAVMEIRGCDAEAAAAILDEAEREGLTTAAVYGRMQGWLGDRMLVDKTPSYALDPSILERAEALFERPRYLHLLRHPHGMIRSFEEAKLDQIFFRKEHPFRRRELAELIWRVSQENILAFLAQVPAERQHRVAFEDLVERPEEVMAGVCAFLGIAYAPAMARPYEKRRERMTDGIHAESRMLGDVKFHQHRGVERETAERWRSEVAEDFLGEGTWRVAESLGYGRQGLATIPPGHAREGEPLPLSFAQERLWFLDQLDPGNPTYNIPLALELAGRLDVPALAASLAEIVRRHASLRTTFAAAEGRPVQVIARAAGDPLVAVDLAGLGEERAEAEARRIASALALLPFDLRRGPLVRAVLVRLAEERHVAVFAVHHIVADGWSMGVLVRELGALYAAALSGAPSPLPEPPIQYADFAVWQRGRLAGEELARQLAFWRERLAGAPAALDLPADWPRPPVQRYRGASRDLALPAALSSALRRLSHGRGATLFMTLLSGFQALLARLSGQDDLVVGTTIANRTRRELEGLIGFFVNTLALRADLGDDPGFALLIDRARRSALGAFAHQDLPFEKLVEELRLPRDPSRSPLFQVVFQMQNAPAGPLALPGLALSPVEAVTQTAKFDLVLNLFERGEALAGVLRYNTDLFDAPTAARWLAAYERLLAGAVEEPERPVSELPLLSPAERQELVQECSAGAALPLSETSSLAGLVARQAAVRPDAVAVSLGEERLSYGELASRAQRLAGRLLELGVGRGGRVGLLFERSAEMVVAIVGTLWAGAAYVPLDPDYPEERLRFALEDSGVPVVLTAGDVADRLELHAGVRRLRLEEVGEGESAPEIAAGPDDVAYVIYTSGSTGRPKGVLVTHGNVLRLLAATEAWFSFDGSDVWTLFHSYAFDFSVWELWGALGYGGRLAVVPYWVSRSPSAFLELLSREGVTVLNQTPSAFLQLARAEESARRLGEAPDLSALRSVVFGGERLEPAALAPWWERHGDERPLLVNMYGITETTVHVTYRVLDVADAALGSRIGRPIPDLSVYLLDRHLEPVVPGSPGEIVVGGAGVAVGYLGRPELTAQRFVPDPFGGAPGARLYRSGDLARYHADGDIGDMEVLGRIDRQVKVRGFRIELGEIESALRASAEIADAAVLVLGETAEERRLVACVMPKAGASPSPAALRDLVAASLPDYMVPSRIVALPSLPLTANGKLDRAALTREIEWTEAAAEPAGGAAPDVLDADAEPTTVLERFLAGLFAAALKRERVGLDDDFFALGGNSIQGAVLVNRLQEELGEIVHVVTIFDAPTVRRLAEYLAAEHPAAVALRWPEGRADGAAGERGDGGTRGLAGIPPGQAREGEPLPLSFAQERLWLLDQLDPANPTYNIPLALELEGPLSIAALAASLAGIARRHAALRTAFPAVEGHPAQVISPPAGDLLVHIDLAGLPVSTADAEARRLAREDALRPFDLQRGPLARAALVRVAQKPPEHHVVLVNLHHIVADGWSMGVLVRELGALYGAAVAGAPSPLAALPVQYADYAVWQRRQLSGAALERELAHWRAALAGIAPLELPTDRPRPPVQTFRGGGVRAQLPPPLAAELAEAGRGRGLSLFMTLAAASAALLSRHAGQEDVALGTAVANRGRAEVEGLIGFFVNTLVLRADCAGEPTFADLLARVRAAALAAFAHQDLPFERIVEEVNPRRDPGRTPLFQVMLTLQEWESEEVSLPGLRARRLDPAGGLAKFDLSIAWGDAGSGLGAGWGFNRDLFDASTIARLAAHFEVLAAAAVRDPDLRLSALPLLSAAEQAQLAVEWNDRATSFPREETIDALFLDQASRRPDAVAIEWGAAAVTYGALAARATALARRLCKLFEQAGAGPEAAVALALPRSPAFLEATVAVLLAGGAYVPLDLAYPRERLALLLSDVGAPVVVTEERFRARVAELSGNVAILSLDGGDRVPPPWEGAGWGRGEDRRGALVDEDVSLDAAPESLAYVLYTSGSTGVPKGVAVPHRAVVRLVRDTDFAQLGPEDRTAQVSSTAFDAATFEIWGALLNGGRVVGIEKEVALATADFAAELRERQVTAMFLTSSLFTQVAREAPEAFAAFRFLLVGGEAVEPAAARRVLAAAPPARLLNGYGPTESTTFAVTHPIALVTPEAASIPIGRPIANTTAHVLDAAFRPVPIGVLGELFLGGDGLARGYLGRPDLTAERFLPDGASGAWGARLYRTGDRARALASGAIDYLGRTDGQVKVRGFRIELGEVEAALSAHPRVERAAVVVRGASAGERRLAAFTVARPDGPSPAPAELRAHLRARLPEHMIPSAFVALDDLPLNANGKVDRRALAERDAREAEGEGRVAPRTAVEEVVAGFWAEVLGRERVGVEDDFFDLGGHSLLAAQVVSRVASTFQVKLPLRRLFDRPTVAGLAAAVAGLEARPGQGEKIARALLKVKAMAAARREPALAESDAREEALADAGERSA